MEVPSTVQVRQSQADWPVASLTSEQEKQFDIEGMLQSFNGHTLGFDGAYTHELFTHPQLGENCCTKSLEKDEE